MGNVCGGTNKQSTSSQKPLTLLDIEDSKRVKQESSQISTTSDQHGTTKPTPTVPLSTGVSEKVGNFEPESYTDLRMKEKDMFQDIINQTAQNFIKINQSPGALETSQYLMQQNKLSTNVMEKEAQNPELFGIPDFSTKSEKSIKQQLMEEGLSSNDLIMMQKLVDAVANAYASIKVNEENVGQLLVKLPEVEAQ